MAPASAIDRGFSSSEPKSLASTAQTCNACDTSDTCEHSRTSVTNSRLTWAYLGLPVIFCPVQVVTRFDVVICHAEKNQCQWHMWSTFAINKICWANVFLVIYHYIYCIYICIMPSGINKLFHWKPSLCRKIIDMGACHGINERFLNLQELLLNMRTGGCEHNWPSMPQNARI